MKYLARSRRSMIVMLLVTMGTGTAAADWHDFWHGLHIGYHRNNAWPQPFSEADAHQVVAPFEVMKRNGWRVHNTIGHELFRQGDGVLLAAGHNRVRWIAMQAPVAHREVFVLRGKDEAETQARVAAVREAVNRLQITGPVPQIYLTDVEPATAPGAWATKINRDRLQQMVPPKLPSTSASGQAGATAN